MSYKTRIIVVDYRLIAFTYSFHSRQPITSILPKLANLLLKNNITSGKIVFAVDIGKSKRVNLYPEYKAHRALLHKKENKATQERRNRFEASYKASIEYLKYFGSVMHIAGIEADDIASIFANRYKDTDTEIILVSSDSDWASYLFYSNIKLLHVKRERLIGIDNISEEYEGLDPLGIFYSQVFAGSVKENVKGLVNFGKATFLRLYNEYKELGKDVNNFEEFSNYIESEIFFNSDSKYKKVKLPDNTTFIDMVSLNYTLFKPLSYDDLESNEQNTFRLNLNNKEKTTYDELLIKLLNYNITIPLSNSQKRIFGISQ